jgi:hypothetical protein
MYPSVQKGHTSSQYKYIQPVGKVSNYYFHYHKTNDKHKIDVLAQSLLNHTPTSGVVAPTKSNVAKAVSSYDEPFTHPLGKSYQEVEENYDKSFEFGTKESMFLYSHTLTKDYVGGYIPRHGPCSVFNVDFSTGSGVPYNFYHGFLKKADVPLSLISDAVEHWDQPAIWKISAKRERMLLFDINEENKIRTFTQPPFHYLVQQQIFSYTFNGGMKDVPWSAYGFDWHHGGFNRLIQRLAIHENFTEWDVSKWDKRLPTKYDCTRIRRHLLEINSEEEANFYKMRLREQQPLVLLPNGDLVQMQSGQVSGSANTTSDNTLSHIQILMYLCVRAYYDKLGEYPTLQFILSNVEAALYGDDNLCGFSDFYHGYLDDKDFITSIMMEFGLVIKNDPKKFNSSKSVIGHTFLGMEVTFFRGRYVPYYAYSKVLDSSVVLQTDCSIDIKKARYSALLNLLVFTPHYEEFSSFVKKYFDSLDMKPPFIYAQADLQRIELGTD